MGVFGVTRLRRRLRKQLAHPDPMAMQDDTLQQRAHSRLEIGWHEMAR